MNNASTQKFILFVLGHANGNPNGDPDNDNAPRRDYSDDRMLRISDVCVRRRFRNYWQTELGKDVLYKGTGAEQTRSDEAQATAGKGFEKDDAERVLKDKFLDLRLFGGVLTSGKKSKTLQIRGSVNGGQGHSLHPVQEDTRVSITGTQPDKLESTFGEKHVVPVVYTKHAMLYTPPKDGSVSNDDLDCLYKAIVNAHGAYSTSSKPLAWFERGLVVEASGGVGRYRPVLLSRVSPFKVSKDFEDWGTSVPLFPEDLKVGLDYALVEEMASVGIHSWELK